MREDVAETLEKNEENRKRRIPPGVPDLMDPVAITKVNEENRRRIQPHGTNPAIPIWPLSPNA